MTRYENLFYQAIISSAVVKMDGYHDNNCNSDNFGNPSNQTRLLFKLSEEKTSNIA